MSCTEHFMYTGHRIAAPSAVELHYSVGYLLHCSQSAVLQNAVIQLHLGQESNFQYRGWVKKKHTDAFKSGGNIFGQSASKC